MLAVEACRDIQTINLEKGQSYNMTIYSSHLSGVSHSSDYHMWKRNDHASNGVRDFAEKGEAWALIKEIEAAGEKIQSVHGIFSAPSMSSGTGHASTEFEVHTRHPYVSTRYPKCKYQGLLFAEQLKP